MRTENHFGRNVVHQFSQSNNRKKTHQHQRLNLILDKFTLEQCLINILELEFWCTRCAHKIKHNIQQPTQKIQ